jgi:hypothetical protein
VLRRPRCEARSILARLHDAIVNNVVDDGAVRVGRGQQHSLRGPPRVVWAGFGGGASSLWRGRHKGDGIEDLGQPAQRPFLVEPGGQDPFALGLCRDMQAAGLSGGFGGSPLAVGVLEQLDLLVGVDVDALRRQARHQRPRQGRARERGMGVHVQGGPVVLVGEVVLYLQRERLQLRKVRSGRVDGRNELLQRGRRDWRGGREGRHLEAPATGGAGGRLVIARWCVSWRVEVRGLLCCLGRSGSEDGTRRHSYAPLPCCRPSSE